MGRRTGANLVRNNMHKVGRTHSDKEIAKAMLRNHEKTAQQFYLEDKPDTDCQETLDAIRFAHDRLGMSEIDEDFNIKRAIQQAKKKQPLPQPSSSTLSDTSSDDDNQLLGTFLQSDAGKPQPAQAAVQILNSDNTNLNQLPNVNKQQLTYLAMKANLEFQKMLMNTIQQM